MEQLVGAMTLRSRCANRPATNCKPPKWKFKAYALLRGWVGVLNPCSLRSPLRSTAEASADAAGSRPSA